MFKTIIPTLITIVAGLKLLIELGIIRGTLIKLSERDKEFIDKALTERKITVKIGTWSQEIDISDMTGEQEEVIRDVVADNKISWKEALKLSRVF